VEYLTRVSIRAHGTMHQIRPRCKQAAMEEGLAPPREGKRCTSAVRFDSLRTKEQTGT